MHACLFSICMYVRANVCIGAISCRAAHAPARLCVVSADEVAGTRSQKCSLYCVCMVNVLGHLLCRICARRTRRRAHHLKTVS